MPEPGTSGPVPPGSGWRPAAALTRAVVLTVLTVGGSLGFGRADLALIGAPITVGLVLALSARRPSTQPDRTPPVRATARVTSPVIGGAVAVVEIEVTAPPEVQLTSVVAPGAFAEPARHVVTLPGSGRVDAPFRLPRWGREIVALPDLTAAGPDGLWQYGPVPAEPLRLDVPPVAGRIEPLALPPIYGGWAGDHASRRSGQGGDLIDLREYAPGDRLRSVHWRAYARHQKLYVRRTQTDADADFVLCIDTRDEIRAQPYPAITAWQRFARSVGDRWSALVEAIRGMFVLDRPRPDDELPEPSSFDLAVEAAATVAAAQLKAGDRVGLLDLAHPRRHVRMGTGTRHRERIRHQLAVLDLPRSRLLMQAGSWDLPTAAVVVLISPLSDDAVVQAAVDLQMRGHAVFAIDTLPRRALVTTAGDVVADRAELGLLLAERDQRIDRLRRRGIPVAAWETGSLAADLKLWRRSVRERR